MGEVYTGGMLEEEMLGKIESKEEEELLDIRDYIEYEDAIDIVKSIQPKESDPTDPDPYFASDLHTMLAENLELEDYSDLEYYTAVSSRFDFFHGVDAFFEWKLPGGRVIMATFDVTKNREKLLHKADVITQVDEEDLDMEEHKAQYLAFVEDQAHRLGIILRNRRDKNE